MRRLSLWIAATAVRACVQAEKGAVLRLPCNPAPKNLTAMLAFRLRTCAAALLCFAVFAGCNDIEQPDLFLALLSGGGQPRIGVISSDLGAAGRFTALNEDGLVQPGSVPVHSDAVARYAAGRVYVINRLNRDSIQVLRPDLGFAVEQEWSVGAGSNPQDIAIANESTAFVALYARAELRIYNPATGLQSGAIDLSAYADADGLPEVSALHLEGDRLYAALQRLDRNDSGGIPAPTDRSLLLEIEVASGSITGEFVFPGVTNPFGRFQRVTLDGAPHLIIPCPGFLGFITRNDGGVAAFNLETRSFRPGLLLSEQTTGADILDVALRDAEAGYASVLDAAFNKRLIRFDPGSGAIVNTLEFFPADAGFVSGLLLAPSGRLYTGNATFSSPGVSIYDTRSGDRKLTAVPIQAGLRPIDLVYIPAQ